MLCRGDGVIIGIALRLIGTGGIAVRSFRQRQVRFLRVGWHDTRALLSEFRKPLIVFFVSIFVGGLLYGHLNNTQSDNESLALVEMPYVMLALMVLETPVELPDEPYLIAFWYLQPLLAVYIVGQGAAQFLRLFFLRDQRRSAWEAALASTYRNHIIVVGVGHVGLRIIRELRQMNVEVVAVDLQVSEEGDSDLRAAQVPLILGDARIELVLESAGLPHARAVIIATSDDHINLEVTMRVQYLKQEMGKTFPLIARMWDDSLKRQIESLFADKNVKVMSASDLVAPAFAWAAVTDIEQTLQIDDRAYNLIRLTVGKKSFMVGKTVHGVEDAEGVDIVLLHRGKATPEVHPRGDRVLRAGDTLMLFAEHDRIIEIVKRNDG